MPFIHSSTTTTSITNTAFGHHLLLTILLALFILNSTVRFAKGKNDDHYSEKCPAGSQPFRNKDGSFLKCADELSSLCVEPYECNDLSKYCCPKEGRHHSLLLMDSHHGLKTITHLESEKDHERFCGTEGRLYKEKNNRLAQCKHDSDCLPPSVCYNRGYCCLLPLAQEPPPIGCPKGTRPLKNVRGEELSCSPNHPGSCPGGTMCYEDSFDGSFRCCGKDPSEGCASGTRALKHANGTTRLCMPGTSSEVCPGRAICQWSFAIDRYQCCEPDNGCPLGQSPVIGERFGEVLECSLQDSAGSAAFHPSCPEGAVCTFNFWIAAHQCCARSSETEICPIGEVPYLLNDSPNLVNCHLDEDCPSGFYCSDRSKICCGEPGRCPAGSNEQPYRDKTGALQSCSLADPGVCPDGSECLETYPLVVIGDWTRSRGVGSRKFSTFSNGQRLCCAPTTAVTSEPSNPTAITDQSLFRCELSGQPFPSAEHPQLCNVDNPMACPVDMLCQRSNVPGVNICCIGALTERNLCPKGWSPHEDLTIFCHPTLRNSCPGFSSCILSPVTQQFLCCEPELVGNEGSEHHSILLDRHRPCRGGRYSERRRHSAAAADRRFEDTLLACPNTVDEMKMVNGRVRRCSAAGVSAPRHKGRRSRCGSGFECHHSSSDSGHHGRSICCGKRKRSARGGDDDVESLNVINRSPDNTAVDFLKDDALFRCPNPSQHPYLENGHNRFCNIINPTDCPSGTICQSAINSANMFICCYNSFSNVPVCPSNTAPQPSVAGFVPCDLLQPNQCRQGYLCVPAINDPSVTLCCSRTTVNRLICPHQQSLYFDGGRPRYCTLNQQAPCPAGFSCQESVGQPGVFVCCSVPSSVVCPSGYAPSTDYYSGNVINCSPSDINVCPSDAQCLQASNRAGAYICCRSTASPRVCPYNQHALLRPNTNQPETCTGPNASCSTPTYTCQFSSVLNAYVCCGRSQSPVLCADGRETYVQEIGKTFTCNPMAYPRECPSGYECAHSSVGNTHVCCRQEPGTAPTFTTPAVAAGGPTQSPADQFPHNPGAPTPPPPSAATFRPLIDDIACPVGWSAYEDNKGAHHFCLDALDMSCPQGFSCAQSSFAGIFMCCRLASNIQCPKSYSPLLINNSPRLCSGGVNQPQASTYGAVAISSATAAIPVGTRAIITQRPSNGCPIGHVCMQSSVPAVYVCCSASTKGDLLCQDGQVPAYLGQYVRSCRTVGQSDGCPPSYVCAPSDRAGFNVCCHILPPVQQQRRSIAANAVAPPAQRRIYRQQQTAESTTVCGEAAVPYYAQFSVVPLECDRENADVCPQDFECWQSPTNLLKMYCCQAAQCPRSAASAALPSTMPPLSLLSASGRSTTTFSRRAQKCTIDADCRANGAQRSTLRCVSSENIQSVRLCCDFSNLPSQSVPVSGESSSLAAALIPPHPLLPSPQPIVPVSSLSSSSATTPLPTPPAYRPQRSQCLGRGTLLVSGGAYLCDGTNPRSCPRGYECSTLTTYGNAICCEASGEADVCPENRDAYREPVTGEYKFCDEGAVDVEFCPAGYICRQSQLLGGRNLCCSPIAFCPRDQLPFIDPFTNQAKRCFDPVLPQLPSIVDGFVHDSPMVNETVNDDPASFFINIQMGGVGVSRPHDTSAATVPRRRMVPNEAGSRADPIHWRPTRCPRGFTCQESTVGQLYVCCTISDALFSGGGHSAADIDPSRGRGARTILDERSDPDWTIVRGR